MGKLAIIIVCSFFVSSSAAFSSPVSRSKGADKLEPFDIAAAPAETDWRRFNGMDSEGREALWRYHANRSKGLSDWNWAWRIGWVRACKSVKDEFCGAMVKHGLGDRALVVRSEAAVALGERFEGKADATAVAMLERAYDNPMNRRGGKPLFVQFRILFALKQIGGAAALATATRLARQDKLANHYWTRLAKI